LSALRVSIYCPLLAVVAVEALPVSDTLVLDLHSPAHAFR
jgi:hypothetical protein